VEALNARTAPLPPVGGLLNGCQVGLTNDNGWLVTD
jgi:hypothetical protein